MSRVLVYIHGACSHQPGYSDPWWAALQPWTDAYGAGQLGVTRFEVLWSDLINHGGPSALAGCIEDFFSYLYELPIRVQIIRRFTAVVRRLFLAGHTVDVIAHSEGTMVAYEGLRWFDSPAVAMPLKVANFFTLGAALCYAWDPLVPDSNVRDHLLVANQDGAKPQVVTNWWNLNAAGDPFGGPLIPAYGCDKDWLDLPAVGCDGLEPLCAHGSYFNPQNVRVNRDIIANNINYNYS